MHHFPHPSTKIASTILSTSGDGTIRHNFKEIVHRVATSISNSIFVDGFLHVSPFQGGNFPLGGRHSLAVGNDGGDFIQLG